MVQIRYGSGTMVLLYASTLYRIETFLYVYVHIASQYTSVMCHTSVWGQIC